METQTVSPKGRIWAGVALILCTLGILTLLFFDQLASQIVGILGLLLAFLAFPLGNPPLPVLQHILTSLVDILKTNTSKGSLIRIVSVLLTLATGAVALGLFLTREPYLQMANQIKIEKGDAMTDGSEASIRFTGDIPNYKKLDLTLHLENTIGTGDCYQSAIMTLKSRVNGAPKPPINMKGREGRATIDLDREVRDLAISVNLQTDEGCRMKLSATNATFYN